MILLSSIPNIPNEDVPDWTDENFNKVIETKVKLNQKTLKRNRIMNWVKN